MKCQNGQRPCGGLCAGNCDVLGFSKEAFRAFLMFGEIAVENFVKDGSVINALIVTFDDAVYLLLQILRWSC
jgi:hypothetical protein